VLRLRESAGEPNAADRDPRADLAVTELSDDYQ